jgi:hypothetical protein
MAINWRPISEAPQDGTLIWCWLYDTGILLMRQEHDEAFDLDDWVSVADGERYSPTHWVPFNEITPPPNVKLLDVRGGKRWRNIP